MLVLAEGGWSVSNLLTDVSVIFTSAANLIMDNPVPAAFVGLALAGGGIGLFRKVIHIR